jgi:hypothetical protein
MEKLTQTAALEQVTAITNVRIFDGEQISCGSKFSGLVIFSILPS